MSGTVKNAKITVVIGDTEIDLEGTFIHSTPDVMYLRNGDPGEPGTQAEFEIEKVECENAIELMDSIDEYHYDLRNKIQGRISGIIDWAKGIEPYDDLYSDMMMKINIAFSCVDSFGDNLSYKAAEQFEEGFRD